MKTLFNYCSQPRAYSDSYGECLIELESNETIDDVRKQYIYPNRQWYEVHYYDPVKLSSYDYNGKVYKGNLVLLKTKREFLD